jgi:epoxyqueuosine reductase
VARAILALDATRFRARYKDSPMKRAKRGGLARNAAVVLGNTGDGSDVPALKHALEHDEPLVREHAAWAIAEITARY